MTTPCIICVAITGSLPRKSMNSAVPIAFPAPPSSATAESRCSSTRGSVTLPTSTEVSGTASPAQASAKTITSRRAHEPED